MPSAGAATAEAEATTVADAEADAKGDLTIDGGTLVDALTKDMVEPSSATEIESKMPMTGEEVKFKNNLEENRNFESRRQLNSKEP